MILSSFNTLISSNTLTLEEAKSQLQNSVSKDFKTEVLSKLPSQDNIKSQLSTTPVTSKDLQQLEQKFKNLKNRCESQKSKIEAKIQQIESIKVKTTKINNNFSKLEDIINIANDLLPIIKTIISLAPAALAALGGIGTGLAIVRINDGLKIAKSKVNEFESIIKVLDKVKDKITSESDPITSKCDAALGVLNALKLQIENGVCDYIDQVFLQIISQFPNTALLDPDTQTDTTIIFKDPEGILENLENSNKQPFIQYLSNNSKPSETGYRIIKK